MGLLIMSVVPILFGLPYQMLMPMFAVDVLDIGSSGLGYLMAAVGVGALVGSLFVASLGDYKHKGKLLLGMAVCFGAFLIMFANSGNFYLSLILLLGVGLASSSYMAVNTTLLQINVEEGMRGRVMSMYIMTIGLFPLGVLPAGAIAQSTGVAFPITVGGAIIILFTLLLAACSPGIRLI